MVSSFLPKGTSKQRQQLRLQLEQLPATQSLRSCPFISNRKLGAHSFPLPPYTLLPTCRVQTNLINMSPGPQFIELLSFNDYGESHYLAGPIRSTAGIPAGAEDYATDKFDHAPMLTLSAYYNSWFVNGAPPTIKTEGIIWWYR